MGEDNLKKLKDLKAGDKVYYLDGYCKAIKTIDKITPSGLIKIGKELFKSNGYLRGGSAWCVTKIKPLTEQDEIEFYTLKAKYKLKNLIKDIDFNTMNLTIIQYKNLYNTISSALGDNGVK